MKKNLKKLAVLLVIIATLCTFTVTAMAFTDAKAVAYDTVYNENFTSAAKDDYYKISLGSYSQVIFTIATEMTDFTVTVYDANQKQVWTEKQPKYFFQTNDTGEYFFKPKLDAGDYFVKLSSTKTGNYMFRVAYKLAQKEVGETDPDTNNSILTAKSVALNAVSSGKLLKEGEQDYYKFVLPASGTLKFHMVSKMRYYSAAIIDDAGNQIWNTERNEWDSAKKQREDTHTLELSAGTYYLKINGLYREIFKRIVATGNYSFKLSFTSAGATEIEPNDSSVLAKKISLNKTIKGHLSITDTKDVYEVTIADGELAIGFVSNMSKYSIYITDEFGSEKWSSKNNNLNGDAKSRSDLHKTKLGAGKYYIRVEGSTGKYSFKVDQTISLSKVSSLKYSRSVTYLKLKWGKVTNAHGYEVFKYDEAKKEYVKIGSTSKNYITVKKLSGGTTYKFKVRAYRKINGVLLYGGESEILTAVTTPSKASIKSVKAGASGSKQATVTWGKITGADGYRIYYSVDRDFETVSKITVKPGDDVSEVVKNLKKGRKYYFRVRAFKKVDGKNVWGKYSNTKSVTVK